MKIAVNNIMINIEKNQTKEIIKELENIGIKESIVRKIDYRKRSIDSRKKSNIKFVYNLEVELNKRIDISRISRVQEIKHTEEVIRKPREIIGNIAVIGAGPAGLFAALRLAEYGFNPIVFEMGEDVDKRYDSVQNFFKNNILNTKSNIQFGEGGAGTFSDGKLTTRIKSEYIEKVFQELVECGAQEEILYHYKPHIGTDVLMTVVKKLRKKIKKLGGRFYFESEMTDIDIADNQVKSITINGNEKIEVSNLILAVGHSSRKIYRLLHKKKVVLENKNFAIGVRIEHPREIIDKMQYGKYFNNKDLGAATYNYTCNTDRGIFTFCMCPGGEIVNAASEENTSLVNGMSYSGRDGKFSNAAVVVGISEKDYGQNLFDGVRYQEKLERRIYEVVGGYGSLYQNLNDYINNRETKTSIESSYKMDLKSYNLNDFFPEVINKNLHAAFKNWERNKSFISEYANLLAAETRTSAPIRIKRERNGSAVGISNLYPIGEGAGYAGGITSAAVDGLKIVDMNFADVQE